MLIIKHDFYSFVAPFVFRIHQIGNVLLYRYTTTEQMDISETDSREKVVCLKSRIHFVIEMKSTQRLSFFFLLPHALLIFYIHRRTMGVRILQFLNGCGFALSIFASPKIKIDVLLSRREFLIVRSREMIWLDSSSILVSPLLWTIDWRSNSMSWRTWI